MKHRNKLLISVLWGLPFSLVSHADVLFDQTVVIEDAGSASHLRLRNTGDGSNAATISFIDQTDNTFWQVFRRDGAYAAQPDALGFSFFNGTSWYENLLLQPNKDATFKGRVGIPLITPTHRLHVLSDGTLGGVENPNYANGALRIEEGSSNLYFDGNSIYATERLHLASDTEFLDFATGRVSRMRLTNTGEVGIGTLTPSSMLEVAGTVTATAFAGDGSQLTGLAAGQIQTSGSNVGIGVSPSEKLDVAGDVWIRGSGTTIGGSNIAAGALRIGNSLGIDNNEFYFQGVDGVIGTTTNNSLRFKLNGGDRMVLAPDGKLGLGISSPRSHFQIGNSITFFDGDDATNVPDAIGFNAYRHEASGEWRPIRYKRSARLEFDPLSGSMHLLMSALDGTNPDASAQQTTAFSVSAKGEVTIGKSASNYGILTVADTNPVFTLMNETPNSGLVTMRFSHTQHNQRKTALISEATGSWGRSDLHIALDSAADLGDAQVSDAKVTIRNNGNVGIGTRSPGRLLQVGNSNGANNDGIIRFAHYDSGPGNSRVWDVGTGDGSIYGHNDNFGFRDAFSGKTVLTLERGSGEVGVGTSTPEALLDVNGSVRLRGNVVLDQAQGDIPMGDFQ